MRPPDVVAEELELLERVAKLLEGRPQPGTSAEAPLVRELERLREQILARRDSKDAMALHEQWHRQSSLLRQLRTSRAAPQVDPRSPYFGHLRLREGDGLRDLCLGRATCIEGGVRIVDWRHAPISRLFYRYAQGDEYEEEIAGHRREGEVVARRTVSIRDGVLERVEAPEGVYRRDGADADGWEKVEAAPAKLAGGEGSALRAHGAVETRAHRLGGDGGPRRGLDKRLPEITALIDPAQFDLIARPRSGFLVIRGAAGSGKTTVALHRIAYLAYDDPEIASPETLFVVFSPGLRQYVGHVLPALGVEGVAVRTYEEWAAEQRRRHFPGLPAAVRHDAPAVVQRLKVHPVLGAALAQQVERVGGRPDAAQAQDDWASVLTQPRLLEETCARVAPGAFKPGELAEFVEWTRRQIDGLAGEPAEAALEPEDDALLLRAWQLRAGPLRGHGAQPLRYRHVAVDEVQDFSPLEVQVLLGCLGREASLTLAGDVHQHLVEHSGFTSWAGFLKELGLPGAELETLRVSYRSTQQIMEVALSVLGDLVHDEPPPRSTRRGPPVELFRFTDRGACVAFLAEALIRLADAEPLASVAVLAPSPEASEIYHRGLASCDVPRLRRVQHQDFTFAPGVEVTEIEQVKGLEFDYVILVDGSDEQFPDRSPARRRLHVAATRAVHQLWITCVGTPTSLLRELGG